MGIGVPYLGWPFLIAVAGLFFFCRASHGSFSGEDMIGYFVLYCFPYTLVEYCLPLIPRYSKNNPVYGVGVFSRTWHDDTANNPEKGTLRQ